MFTCLEFKLEHIKAKLHACKKIQYVWYLYRCNTFQAYDFISRYL